MEVPKLDNPVKVALIGTGNRASTIYQPLLPALKDWVEVVACVDPVQEHCDRAAAALGARAYYDVRELVKDGIAEAALVVTPVQSHYAYSIYLSSHGIHNMCETSWCSLIAQAREMIRVAREQGVVVRVAENFFRFACDRFALDGEGQRVYRPHWPHLQLRRPHRVSQQLALGALFWPSRVGAGH